MISSTLRLAALVAVSLATPSLATEPVAETPAGAAADSPARTTPPEAPPPPASAPPDGVRVETPAAEAEPNAGAQGPSTAAPTGSAPRQATPSPDARVASSAQRDAETGLVREEGESLRAFTVRVNEARRLKGRSQGEIRALQPKVLVPAAIGLGTGIASGLFAVESLRVGSELKLRKVDNRTALGELVARGNHATTWAVGMGAVSVVAWSVSAYYLFIDQRPPAVSVVPMMASPGITLTGVLP